MYKILVNKENKLPKNYVPNNLIMTDLNEGNFHKYLDSNLKPMIDINVFDSFLKMQEKALEDGFYFIIDSGYRSYEYQEKIYEKNINEKGLEYANNFVAKPGTSEHQTGLACDIAIFRNGKYDDNLKESEINWLKNNAYKYGFILRYPEGKEHITGYNYEPWHYRYVGELAEFLYKNNLTLEEYHLKHDYDNNTKIKIK